MDKKVMIVFGTRPEAVKMCPLARELRKRPGLRVVVCVTGQHRQLLDQALAAFGVTPDHDLALMEEGQSLSVLTARVLESVTEVLEREKPDILLVHGDTTTALASAMAGFYRRIDVGHVEAGLRTYDLTAPFPEEFNRQGIGLVARWHFAPTERARENLLREGKDPSSVFVTGNTGIDALQYTLRPDFTHPLLDWAGTGKLVLLTAHRRESLGKPMSEFFRGIARVLGEHPEVRAVYPVHPNPAVWTQADAAFRETPNMRLTEPMDIPVFHNLMARCHLILTDSGGIQEEAAALGKPVLVLRRRTERPEGVEAGGLVLAGTEEEEVYRVFRRLLEDEELYRTMSSAGNPFGRGDACRIIADILTNS